MQRAVGEQYAELFPRHADADLPHVRQRRRAGAVAGVPARRGSTCSTARSSRSAGGPGASSAAGCRPRCARRYEIDDEDYAAKVAAVGAVDVLACHIPPDVPELLYDVAARRFERGSAAVLEAIRDTPAGAGAVRPRPPAAAVPHPHRPDRVRQRRALPGGRGTPLAARVLTRASPRAHGRPVASSTITINAPPAQVLAVIRDVESYPAVDRPDQERRDRRGRRRRPAAAGALLDGRRRHQATSTRCSYDWKADGVAWELVGPSKMQKSQDGLLRAGADRATGPR